MRTAAVAPAAESMRRSASAMSARPAPVRRAAPALTTRPMLASGYFTPAGKMRQYATGRASPSPVDHRCDACGS